MGGFSAHRSPAQMLESEFQSWLWELGGKFLNFPVPLFPHL